MLLAHFAPVRHGIRLALEGFARVCGEAATTDEAISLTLRARPDVCVIGRDLSGGGIFAVREIANLAPDAAIVVLADSPEADDLLACVHAGATGYLPASIGRDPLRRVVLAVAAGEAAIPRGMVRELLSELRVATKATQRGLTQREAQVLSLLRRGQSTAIIAEQLGISPVTVRRHISTMMRKVGAEGRGALARRLGDARETRVRSARKPNRTQVKAPAVTSSGHGSA